MLALAITLLSLLAPVERLEFPLLEWKAAHGDFACKADNFPNFGFNYDGSYREMDYIQFAPRRLGFYLNNPKGTVSFETTTSDGRSVSQWVVKATGQARFAFGIPEGERVEIELVLRDGGGAAYGPDGKTADISIRSPSFSRSDKNCVPIPRRPRNPERALGLRDF